MKPTTKIQKQVVAWANSMPPATSVQYEWAFANLFPLVGKIFKKGEVWCMNCGHIAHEKNPPQSGYTCPYCGQKLSLEYWSTSDVKNKDIAFFTILTIAHGWQVVRTFEARRSNHKGEPTERHLNELYQQWISPDGKEVIASRAYNRSFFFEKWYYDSPFEIKKHNSHVSGYYCYNDMFNNSGVTIYPRYKVLPILKRNGWSIELTRNCRLDPASVFSLLLLSHDAEMLVKSKQIELFSRMVHRGLKAQLYLHAVKVCNRHNYIVADADLWCDYIELLRFFNLDTHNPYYVCPAELQEAHDALVARKRRVEERERAEEKRREAIRHEEEYRKYRGKFFGVVIQDNNISCHVLQSVAEFVEEGEAMHHCVYSNSYFDNSTHPNALILSARDSNGERLETIEVDLKSMKVVQCRGRMNKNTEQHDNIVNLITENMNIIKRAKRRTQKELARLTKCS